MTFALHYQHLVFFAHALEILLHSVVEEDASTGHKEPESNEDTSEDESVLSKTIEFLDHFDVSLDVVVGCARKIEVTMWPRLFDVVGNPKSLFEVRNPKDTRCFSFSKLLALPSQTCLTTGRLKTAASYLLVLHTLEQLDDSQGDAVRLLRSAMASKEEQLCKDILRFIRSIDESGTALRTVVRDAGILEIDDKTTELKTVDS